MGRAERTQEIEKIREELDGVRSAVILEYRGVTVPQVTELRSQIRKSGGHYAVFKNTLLRRAVAGSPLEKLKDKLEGPTAVVWSEKETVGVAKTLAAFAKTVPVLRVKAVMLDGEVLPGAGLDTVASLPSREELRAKLVVLLASPMRRLATALAGPSRNLANVLSQHAEKSK